MVIEKRVAAPYYLLAMQGRRLFYYFIFLGLSFCSAGSYWSLLRYPAAPIDNSPIILVMELLYVLLSHGLSIALVWRIIKTWPKERSPSLMIGTYRQFLSDGWALLSIGFLHTIFIIKNWQTFFIDGDEYYQAVGVLWHPTLQAAVQQHQQPLAYGANRFFEILFGVSEFTMRLPSALYGLLSGLVFFVLLRDMKVSRGLAWITSLFFCLSYHMDRFSHETRPQVLAFLTCLIFLNFSFNFFEESSAKPSRETLIDLSFGVLFFSLSIGLQPIAFIALFTFLTFLFYRRDSRFKYYFAVVSVSLMPAIIITYAVTRFGPPRLHSSLFDEALKFLSALAQQPWREVLFSPYPWSLLLVLLFGGAAFLSFKKKDVFSKWLWILFLQWALFPLLFFSTYKVAVQYGFYLRYLIVLIIPAWISLALAAEYVLKNVQMKNRAVGLSLFFVIMLVAAIQEPRGEADIDIQNRQNSTGVYRQLEARLNPEDWAVEIVVRRYSSDDAYEGVLYMLNTKHEKNKSYVPPFNALLSVTHYLGEIVDGKRPRRLIFIFQASDVTLAKTKTLLEPLPYVQPFTSDHGYLVYQYLLGDDGLISQEFIDILENHILPVEQRSLFQAPMLELSNAVLQKDKNRIEALKQKIEKLLPDNLVNQNEFFRKLVQSQRI